MTHSCMLTIPPTNHYLLAAKQKENQKALLLTKNTEFSGEREKKIKSGEWPSRQEKKKSTERAMGVGRRRRERIVKWDQMTALRLKKLGRHETSRAFLWGNREDKGKSS